MKVLIVLSLLAWGFPALAEVGAPAEKEKVIWILQDWPKPSLPAGAKEFQKESVFQKLTEQVQEALPSYEHHMIRGHFDKGQLLWKEGKKACVLPILKTKQRIAMAEITAILTVPPYRVIVRNSQVENILGKKKSVTLSELLSNKNLKGGLIEKRSYTESLDRILEEQKGFRNWTLIEPTDWKTVLSMVKNERLDYTIEMSEFVRSFNKANPVGQSLVALPVKELPQPIVGYIACNKNEWGRSAIRAIDKRLQEISATTDYRKDIELLFVDDGVKNFDESLQEFFKKRSEGPWINQ